jgi:hypothetical protein
MRSFPHCSCVLQVQLEDPDLRRLRADLAKEPGCRVAELGFSMETGMWTYKMLRVDKVRRLESTIQDAQASVDVLSTLANDAHRLTWCSIQKPCSTIADVS